MDYHDRFRRAAAEAGLPEDEAARFTDLLRFRIRAGAGPDGVRAGQFGGLPHLPVGMPWPSVSPGAPLAFITSLDCAALPRIAGLALPEAGSLLFFLAAEAAVESCSVAEEQKFAQVLYVPTGTATVATEPPPDEYDDDPLIGPEHVLFAQVEPDLPEWLDEPPHLRSGFRKNLVGELPHRKELDALLEQLWPGRIPWIDDDIVLVGGYPCSAQDSPEVGPADDEAEHRDWVALAQFCVPHQDYVNGRFLIRHDDLAAERFDQALSFCEFTE